jgi:hypothetical protein
MATTESDTTAGGNESENNQNGREAEAALAALTDAVADVKEAAEELESVDVDDAANAALIEAVDALKDAESVAEDTRKDAVEPALEARVETGDTLNAGDIRATRVEGHSKFVYDDDAVLAALEEAEGVDPEDATEVKASAANDLLAEADETDPDDHIGRATYSYFRVTRD